MENRITILVLFIVFGFYGLQAQINHETDGFRYVNYMSTGSIIFNPLQQTLDSCDFVIDAGKDMRILLGESIQIKSNPTEGINYSWYPSTGLSNSNIANPYVSPSVTTLYILTATNKRGCIKIDSVNIEVVRPVDGVVIPTHKVDIDSTFAYDRFGNTYTRKDISIKDNLAASCIAGFFQLDFPDDPGTGFNDVVTGTQRRLVACQVFSDLSELIVPALDPCTNMQTIPLVKLEVYGASGLPPGALGAATSYYDEPASTGGFVDGLVWKTINGGHDSWYSYHGLIRINFYSGLTWHDDLTTSTATGAFDLYTVILHEAIHTLGFASFIASDGSSVIGADCYSRFDKYLQTNSNLPFITNPGNCFNTSFNVSTSDLTNPCATIFQGTNPQPVFTPTTFLPGSSLSHFDEGCPPGLPYVMTWAQGTGPAWMKRHPLPEEVSALCDLGYNTTNTFGAPGSGVGIYYSNYTPCSDRRIAGVNDRFYFCTDVPYEVCQGGSITINDILLNDDDNGNIPASFECLTPLVSGTIPPTGAGTVSNTSGTSFTYTPDPNFVGFIGLRYVPVSSDGRRGNITYITISVTLCCPTTDCNLVCGGDFESIGNIFVSPLSDFRISPYNNTPDLFNDNILLYLNSIDYPVGCSNTLNPYPHDYPAKHKYIGLGGFSGGEEGIFFKLSSPMISGNTYDISFWANGKTSSCLPVVKLVGSTDRPCYFPPNVTSMSVPTNCGSFTFTPVQIADVPITTTTWEQYSATFTVPSGSDLNYITTSLVPLENAGWIDDIEVHLKLNVDAGPNVTIPCFGYTQLNASVNCAGPVNYNWTPSTGLSCTNCPNPIARPNSTTTYTVTVTDVNGCTSASSSTTVNVNVDCRCTPPPPGLVAWWPLEDPIGSATIKELIGGATSINRGIPKPGPVSVYSYPPTGPVPANTMIFPPGSKVSDALYLLGGISFRSFIEVPTNPGITLAASDITIDAWIHIPKEGYYHHLAPIVEKMEYIGSSEVNGYSFYFDHFFTNLLTFKTASGGVVNTAVFSKFLLPDTWYFVSVTLERSTNTVTLYVDDEYSQTTGFVAGNINNSASLLIGRRGNLLHDESGIVIDELEIFNRALSTPEVNTLFLADAYGKCKPGLTGQIQLAVQGFYNVTLQNLNMRDTLTAILRNVSPPFNVVDSSTSVIDSTTFTGDFTFKNAQSGNYYIVLRHRNSIETWSKAGGESFKFGSPFTYDFTSAQTQAFGNNTTLKGTKYCIYSGDVNQDGYIDLIDIIEVYNNASNFVTGYVVTDLNGDNVTDLTDMQITLNNSSDFIIKINP